MPYFLFNYQQLYYVKVVLSVFLLFIRVYRPGASKGTPGDAKCVTEILGGTKIRKYRGTKFKIVSSRCPILRLKCIKFDFGPRPRWRSSQRSPRPPNWIWGGPTSKGRGGNGREGKGERKEKEERGKEGKGEGRGGRGRKGRGRLRHGFFLGGGWTPLV